MSSALAWEDRYFEASLTHMRSFFAYMSSPYVAIALRELRVEHGPALGEPLHCVLLAANFFGDVEVEPLFLDVHDLALVDRGVEARIEGIPDLEPVALGQVVP